MLNIVVPMAGAGSRFAVAGYKDPKPLIPVHGVPMIKVVIDNLTPACEHRFIFICQAAHVEAYGLQEKLQAWAPGCAIVELDGLTEGAACTVYAARELINSDDPVMIANSDQYVDIDINDYLRSMEVQQADGLIMTMKADDPKWSFVGFDEAGRIDRVIEKEVISDEATVGIYNFRSGRELIAAIESMFDKDLRVNGEFYVAPAYNEMIGDDARIVHYSIGSEGAGMYGLGIPADLDLFLGLSVSQAATAGR
ncbi:glycosyltransferase family 2 protein [Pseudomonas nitroreducens]|uniref:Glycosyltransferase family 2 protein n=1 Tax=Pseudomonas nitroreducens TaxID=46680 RepID=A0A6G6J3D9_PSENT|nr:glycosyltransferase family 2 protein [Pseudomonas nitroreducens]MBG6289417.1 glycosyltransferase family 2 protein [Pseudomonas nitroreducens]MDG9855392.1 glycosyltransferase family 2 protein [Pseudomonas nitroreducens]NMZ60344.1 NTP transferase domain-containing protein [Pseudomonas nitroreducens]QIE89956.1 NTP transferase domain-containing protein [Pseudomonas nitroreducens]SNT31198.1 Nucleotidyl transferase [Pseudomonas nitroreducens]